MEIDLFGIGPMSSVIPCFKRSRKKSEEDDVRRDVLVDMIK